MAALLAAGCGARTGLRVDPPPPVDASVDAPLAPEPRCRPLRVRARVGTEAALTLVVDEVTARSSGFTWALRQAPRRSRAMVTSSGDDRASLTPDVEGSYDLLVTTPYRLRSGEALSCPVTVLADPLDPLCPGDALEEPTVAALTRSQAQLALDPAWSTPRVADDAARSFRALATDAPSDDVAALVMEMPESRALAEAAGEWEGRIAASVGAVPVLVGREGRTDEGWALRRSSFRLASLETSAAVVRDRVARDVAALNPGPSRPGFRGARSFTLEVTTVLRPEIGRAIVLVAAAPEGRFDDARATTAQLDLGLCLEDLGDVPGAIVAFRAASARLHSDARAPLSLGLLLADAARGPSPAERTEAIRVLREAMRRAPSDAAVLGLAGPALRRLGEWRLAVDALQRAVGLTPTAALRIELAQALWAAGDRGRALQEATLASRQAPGDLSARYVLALMLAEQGDRAAAATALRAVIEGAADPALRERATAALRRVAPR
jgi:tetratricopeptide (TPR) repeat protein